MIYYVFLLCILAVFAGISSLIMRFLGKWTKKSKYETLFNTFIFIASFFLISFFSIYIFLSNLNFSR